MNGSELEALEYSERLRVAKQSEVEDFSLTAIPGSS